MSGEPWSKDPDLNPLVTIKGLREHIGELEQRLASYDDIRKRDILNLETIEALKAEVERVKDLNDEIREKAVALKRKNERLRDGLRQLEWTRHQGWPGHLACPVCHRYQDDGHKLDCWLAALLKEE